MDCKSETMTTTRIENSRFPCLVTRSEARFPSCRTWRYTLHRVWDEGRGLLMVIGLNPSTADEVKNDPTVTRCINYARA
jgi:hypothetical protein